MLFPNDEKLSKSSDSEYKRLIVPYVNKSSRFMLKSKNYGKQYAHIYASRLREMTELLKPIVEKKWGTEYKIKKLSELREENPDKCVVIGTLFKHQQLKPSILREISEENQLAPQPPRSNFVDENDKLILEDELQRIRLLGKVEVHNLVTGVVCAVLGYIETDGRFMVDDILFYESGPQKSLKTLEDSPLLVLISGLDLSSSDGLSMSLELFQHWLFGNIDGYGSGSDWESASIVRVIVAGNSIRTTPEVKEKTLQTRAAESTNTLDAVKSCDKLFSNWSESVYVDLMPGEFDPSNYMLPQQPLHNCMFPEAYKHKTFQSVPNPYACEVAGRDIVGTAGQNVMDIMRTSKIDDPLEALKLLVKWSHIAPSSPDTLPCYPYVEGDPFIFKECPHVCFAGNQEEFKKGYYNGENGKQTLVVSVPSFITTKSVAVVNLRTLECNQMSFEVNGIEE
ncbi:unnamed protein product [Hermetia illucens]|uniref:DNA polymerase delta subunit 2 n=1 Tax=Hermetia illucens TaxID=343691 RepID=A0A7R8USQ5_HERIL|nr:DNA polymerase delta subunit 2 isoform X2 [Hermetia illucens]CAD7086276.1 unnamed protein product [Hermetia illucens]